MLRVRDGDDAAFNYLVGRYRRAMISFMYRMVHNAAIAEELSQEVFLRVYRSRASYAADAKFTTWLYRIATNLAVNHARDNKHERPEVRPAWTRPMKKPDSPLIWPTTGPISSRRFCAASAFAPSANMSRLCPSGSAWPS